MSIGVATAAADEIALNDLLERADQTLYTAKNGGPNRVEVADDLPIDSDPLPEAARA
jgi:PleD family two-component response regulator